IMAADIIGFKETSLFLNHIDPLGMIFHVQPVADIFAIAVYRKVLSVKGVVDNQRNQLFRELIGPVIIAAVGDVGRETIGVHIRFHQHIGRSLAGGVGTVRIVGSRLIEVLPFFFQGAVHLIGGYMEKFL